VGGAVEGLREERSNAPGANGGTWGTQPSVALPRSNIARLSPSSAMYNRVMAKHVIHVSDAEAASDFASVLDQVSAGAEVIIERDSRPVAVVRPAEVPLGRLLSESIALAEAHTKELGSEPTMDAEFAADLKEIINSRKPRDLSAWD